MSVRWTGPDDTCAAGHAPASLRSILAAIAFAAVVTTGFVLLVLAVKAVR